MVPGVQVEGRPPGQEAELVLADAIQVLAGADQLDVSLGIVNPGLGDAVEDPLQLGPEGDALDWSGSRAAQAAAGMNCSA